MTLQVGRIVLGEGVMRPFEESWPSNGRQVTLNGIMHSDPTQPRLRLAAQHDDLLGLTNSLVPVVFGIKSHRNGYYVVQSVKSSVVDIADQNLIQLVWQIDLVRQGADVEVDLESRLSGPVNRLNDHSLTGERWHAPAQAHSSYWADALTPGQVTRTGSEGAVIVYRALTQTVNPRWYCPVETYTQARSRLTDPAERAGVGVEVGAVWALSNSLVSFKPSGTSWAMSVHDGTSWSPDKLFNFTVGGVSLGVPLAVSVLHNEYERVTVRCLWNRTTSGRVHVDITLRRGSRFVEILMKCNAAATLGIVRATNEASTAGSGFVRATSNDAQGHRYIIGSTRTFTGDLVAGGISKASTVRLDAIVGAEIAGSAAVSGDQAANLMAQYIGTPDEVVQAVRR